MMDPGADQERLRHWESAARASNNTQTEVLLTGLKAALVIGEMGYGISQ